MSYDGGKAGAGVYQQIINQLPPHQTYIEGFLGAGAILRAKRPARRSIGIEIDADVLDQRWRGDEVQGLQLLCADALAFLGSYPWQGDEVLYLDPPYLMETRSYQRSIYGYEFADVDQHQALLALITTLPCCVAISGYWSALYATALAGWRSISFQTVKRSGQLATEWLWMNYPEPIELHDYRYLGRDFRERERIKRQQQRWKARLHRMSTLERQALLAALADVREEAEPRSHPCGSGDASEVPLVLDDIGEADDGCRSSSRHLTMGIPLAKTDDVAGDIVIRDDPAAVWSTIAKDGDAADGSGSVFDPGAAAADRQAEEDIECA